MKAARGLSWMVVAAMCVVGAGSAAVLAHDSWLIADRDRADPGATLRLAFITGEDFPRSESPAKPERVDRWNVVRRAKREKLKDPAIDEKELVARKEFNTLGFHWVEIALKPNFIELPAKDFEEYLAGEKADAALASFQRRSTPDAPARELYTKFAKTWVTIGEPTADATFQQILGHALEIIPQSDPRAWIKGKEIEVKVLLEGQPLPGARVSSGYEGLAPHTYAQTATTDANGVARLTLSKGGLWYLRVHSIRALTVPRAATDEPDAPKADWESFFATVTFRVSE